MKDQRGGTAGVVWTLVILVVVVVILGWVRWATLSTVGRYFWPRSAEDWTSWGTWIGAFGAVGAVYFAARSVGAALKHQEAQRTREAKTEQGRIEAMRESDKHWLDAQEKLSDERKASDRRWEEQRREEQKRWEALRKDEDNIARRAAQLFTWNIGFGKPSDMQYADIAHASYLADLSRRESDVAPFYQDHVERIFVCVDNWSYEDAFHELSLWLAEPGVSAQVVQMAHRDLPQFPERSDEFVDGPVPEWTEEAIDAKYVSTFAPGSNHWALGAIGPRQQRIVVLEFDRPQDYVHWMSFPCDGYVSQGGHVVLGYRDTEKRHWMVSTLAESRGPFRTWELRDLYR